jgi:hypothetical protein
MHELQQTGADCRAQHALHRRLWSSAHAACKVQQQQGLGDRCAWCCRRVGVEGPAFSIGCCDRPDLGAPNTQQAANPGPGQYNAAATACSNAPAYSFVKVRLCVPPVHFHLGVNSPKRGLANPRMLLKVNHSTHTCAANTSRPCHTFYWQHWLQQ